MTTSVVDSVSTPFVIKWTTTGVNFIPCSWCHFDNIRCHFDNIRFQFGNASVSFWHHRCHLDNIWCQVENASVSFWHHSLSSWQYSLSFGCHLVSIPFGVDLTPFGIDFTTYGCQFENMLVSIRDRLVSNRQRRSFFNIMVSNWQRWWSNSTTFVVKKLTTQKSKIDHIRCQFCNGVFPLVYVECQW